ncbi:hypothetical protein [Desulfosporosinus fructosivorans]
MRFPETHFLKAQEYDKLQSLKRGDNLEDEEFRNYLSERGYLYSIPSITGFPASRMELDGYFVYICVLY